MQNLHQSIYADRSSYAGQLLIKPFWWKTKTKIWTWKAAES
jgi:hypothetical protein